MLIKAVALGIFFSNLFTFVYSMLNLVVLTTSLSTTLLKFFKSAGTVFNWPASKSSTFVLKLLKVVGTLAIILKSSLSTSAYKAIKSF